MIDTRELKKTNFDRCLNDRFIVQTETWGGGGSGFGSIIKTR